VEGSLGGRCHAGYLRNRPEQESAVICCQVVQCEKLTIMYVRKRCREREQGRSRTVEARNVIRRRTREERQIDKEKRILKKFFRSKYIKTKER